MLGIIEVDYFGLQYFGPHGEVLWLNLRNPVKQQLSGGSSPVRLLFKVKFHVPPHLLLQESTRNQFFLNLASDVRGGRIQVPDRDLLLKLVSLIAQAEMQDYDSHSITSLKLGYCKWLPLPPDALENMAGGASSSTRMRSRRRKHSSGPSSHSDQETEEEDVSPALSSSAPSPPPLAPVPHNSSSDSSDHEMESSSYSQERETLCEGVMQLHKQLKGIRSCTAKYLFVKEVSDLRDFGVEYFSVRRNSTDESFRLGVGPKGVSVTPLSVAIDGSAADATEEHKNR